ncbi:hypothetical protein [Streptacidiphilus sp. EB129]|uniref:hypothetical protein n=1 Tax=Streptacidiphilus sp. EB129 TaxID=3156262 RepID=UPI0035121504
MLRTDGTLLTYNDRNRVVPGVVHRPVPEPSGAAPCARCGYWLSEHGPQPPYTACGAHTAPTA